MSEELKDMLLLCTKGKTVIHGTQAIPVVTNVLERMGEMLGVEREPQLGGGKKGDREDAT